MSANRRAGTLDIEAVGWNTIPPKNPRKKFKRDLFTAAKAWLFPPLPMPGSVPIWKAELPDLFSASMLKRDPRAYVRRGFWFSGIPCAPFLCLRRSRSRCTSFRTHCLRCKLLVPLPQILVFGTLSPAFSVILVATLIRQCKVR